MLKIKKKFKTSRLLQCEQFKAGRAISAESGDTHHMHAHLPYVVSHQSISNKKEWALRPSATRGGTLSSVYTPPAPTKERTDRRKQAVSCLPFPIRNNSNSVADKELQSQAFIPHQRRNYFLLCSSKI